MDWHEFLRWFLIGFFGGLGWLVVSALWTLIGRTMSGRQP